MSAIGVMDVRLVEQFLFKEARMLDEQRWEDWAQLFVPNGEYWMPASIDQPDPTNHLSLMYETDLLRSIRVARFSDPNAFSLQPMPRSTHLISNVTLEESGGIEGTHMVHSSFIVLQYRRDVQAVLGGHYVHRLIIENGGYKIASKRVTLVNCDSALESILVYL